MFSYWPIFSDVPTSHWPIFSDVPTSHWPIFSDVPTSHWPIFSDVPTSHWPIFFDVSTSHWPIFSDVPTSHWPIFSDVPTSHWPIFSDVPTSQFQASTQLDQSDHKLIQLTQRVSSLEAQLSDIQQVAQEETRQKLSLQSRLRASDDACEVAQDRLEEEEEAKKAIERQLFDVNAKVCC